MSKILKNQTASSITVTDVGITILASPGQYTIPPQDYDLWAASSDVITELTNESVSANTGLLLNDGGNDITVLSDAVDIIKGWFPLNLQSSTHTIYNPISPATPNTEFSQLFPTGTKIITIKSRDSGAVIKYSGVSGESGTKYITINRGVERNISLLDLQSFTLYMQINKPSVVLEIEAWS